MNETPVPVAIGWWRVGNTYFMGDDRGPRRFANLAEMAEYMRVFEANNAEAQARAQGKWPACARRYEETGDPGAPPPGH